MAARSDAAEATNSGTATTYDIASPARRRHLTASHEVERHRDSGKNYDVSQHHWPTTLFDTRLTNDPKALRHNEIARRTRSLYGVYWGQYDAAEVRTKNLTSSSVMPFRSCDWAILRIESMLRPCANRPQIL